MTTSNVLDQIAIRSHTRRARDLAFSLLLAAIAAFSIGSIATAASTARAATVGATPPAAQLVAGASCAIERGC